MQSSQPSTSHHDRQRQIQSLWSSLEDTPDCVDRLLDETFRLAVDQPRIAIQLAREACAISLRIKDTYRCASARTQFAWMLLNAGKPGEAYRQALYAQTISETGKQPEPHFPSRHTIALIHAYVGNEHKAEAIWLDLIRLARQRKFLQREADYLDSLGVAYLNTNRLNQSLYCRERAYGIYSALNDFRRPECATNLARTHFALGNHALAETWIMHAIQHIAPERTSLLADALHTYGVMLADAEPVRLEEARDALIAAAKLPNNEMLGASAIQVDLGRVLFRLNHTADGIGAAELGLSLAIKSQHHRQIARAHNILHDLYTQIGALDEARKHKAQQHASVKQGEAAKFEHRRVVRATDQMVQAVASTWRRNAFRSAPSM